MNVSTLRALVVSLGCLWMTACGESLRTVNNAKWQEIIDRNKISGATIYVDEVDFSGKIVEMSSDVLVIERNGKRVELPAEAVSRVVVPYQGSKKSAHIIGGVVGGGVGIGIGYIAADAASNQKGAKKLAHPLSLLSIIGGTVAGVLVSDMFMKGDNFVTTNTLNKYLLHPIVGSEVTPVELKSYKIFDDLPLDKNEQILQVQVFHFGSNKYLILYDTAMGDDYNVKWKVVDSAYLESQKAKIK
ncbi:hypothetical protein K1X84_16525 [bacterium]|nr:hypothetical protein [bacterium]